VLRLLSDRTLSAGEIAAHFAFTKPTLSRHLKVLREADLVATERKGTVIEYSANLSVLEDTLLGLLGGLGIGEPHGEET
jgi:DNA-binding transcriptional ArsR family regulator